VGFLIFAPITGPVAIMKGTNALKMLNDYPRHGEVSSARGKAIAGITIGIVSLVLVLIGIVARLSK